MNYQMVIQWQEKDISLEKLDEIEKILDYDIGISHEVNGHKKANGIASIFLTTNNPEELLKQILIILNQSELEHAKIAYREETKNDFVVVYPKTE